MGNQLVKRNIPASRFVLLSMWSHSGFPTAE
ncbi:hypothetical protein LOM8899_01482 [Flavimaricola marinus]|uniref:Uncharacterized protein n=1 Tax=Flavimaricola marinus TaxID=1819565 RepID=A0A238LCA2_9RHOB|nr:hypothetical protein LOM8899_01482 [Flavimaricola marinus]